MSEIEGRSPVDESEVVWKLLAKNSSFTSASAYLDHWSKGRNIPAYTMGWVQGWECKCIIALAGEASPLHLAQPQSRQIWHSRSAFRIVHNSVWWRSSPTKIDAFASVIWWRWKPVPALTVTGRSFQMKALTSRERSRDPPTNSISKAHLSSYAKFHDSS